MDYLLHSKKKVWTSGTCNNIDEFQDNYAKWKKPDEKEYTLYDRIYV